MLPNVYLTFTVIILFYFSSYLNLFCLDFISLFSREWRIVKFLLRIFPLWLLQEFSLLLRGIFLSQRKKFSYIDFRGTVVTKMFIGEIWSLNHGVWSFARFWYFHELLLGKKESPSSLWGSKQYHFHLHSLVCANCTCMRLWHNLLTSFILIFTPIRNNLMFILLSGRGYKYMYLSLKRL